MVRSFTKYLVACWAGLSSAHITMKSPVPFGVDTLNSSPLNNAAIGSSGSDFPCKQRTGVYKVSQMNNMPVGQAQTLSFTGSASHGGGTCQLAVSLDHEPTTNSTWKIIQVYEGGCPTAASGNGGTDVFSFKIPDKFPNGQATLAWTWFNRVGNREIYMNCAPITVSGGADNTDYYHTLPNMYVINLPTSDCSSVESSDQIIPNPGQFVLTGDSSGKRAQATGPGCAAAAAAQTKGAIGYQGPAAANSSAAVATSLAQSAVAPSPNNGQYTPLTTTIATTTMAVQGTPLVTAVTGPAGTSPLPLSLLITVPSINAPVATEAPAVSTSPFIVTSQASAAVMPGIPKQPVPSAALPGSDTASPVPSAALPGPAGAPAPLPPVIATSSLQVYVSSIPAIAASPQTPIIAASMTARLPTTLLTTQKAASSTLIYPSNAYLTPVMDGTTTYAGTDASPTAAVPVSGAPPRTNCPQDGVLLCNGPSQFGLCDHGKVVWQAVAAGTTCSNGAITKRDTEFNAPIRQGRPGRWVVEDI